MAPADGGRGLRAVLLDSDLGEPTVEKEILAAAGIELVVTHCTTEDEVIGAARGADAVIVQYAPVTARVIEALAPTLRVISRYGIGIDMIDVDAASRAGVSVRNVPHYSIEDVSDHAVALALAVSRGIVALDAGIREGDYDIEKVKPFWRFGQRTFGLIGFGAIGRATARKAQALGFRVRAHDPMIPAGRSEDGVELVAFEELLSSSDVVSLHVPLLPQTQHLIRAETLAVFRDGAILINTCRGGVVDLDAVSDALASGKLYGAGLDVFEGERIPEDHPILRQRRAALTPHVAWYSEESLVQLRVETARNVVEEIAGSAQARS